MMFFKYTNVSEVIFHDLKDNPATLTPDEAHEVRQKSGGRRTQAHKATPYERICGYCLTSNKTRVRPAISRAVLTK